MSSENTIKDIYFPCKLYNRDVNEGECYDKQVSTNGIDETCDQCEYNQLKSPEISRRKAMAL